MLRARKGQQKSKQLFQEYLKEKKTTKAESKTLLAQGLKTFLRYCVIHCCFVLCLRLSMHKLNNYWMRFFRDIQNYQGLGKCYQPKPNNTYLALDNCG